MALSTEKPSDSAEKSERRHIDPPALWLAVTLGSVAMHVVGFGMLHLLVTGRLQSLQSARGSEVIPVELIADAPEAPSLNQRIPTPDLGANRTPTRINPPIPRTSEQLPNRPSSSAPISSLPPTNSQSRSTQESETPLNQRESPTTNPAPNSPPRPNTQPPATKPSPNPPSGTGTPTQPPATNPAPNPPSGTDSPPQPPATNPAPNPPSGTGTPQQPPTTNPDGGSSFRATPGQIEVVDNSRDVINPDRNPGDKFAVLKPDSKLSFSDDELKQLGITLDGAVVLRVTVLIETDGKATVESTGVEQGNISNDQAQRLARMLVEQWNFEPTRMAGQPVPRYYTFSLPINPG